MGSALPTTPTTTRMAQVQGNNLLDVLKKKMRQTKEEMEKYKEESEDMARKLQVEIRRREEAEGEVAALNRRIQLSLTSYLPCFFVYFLYNSHPPRCYFYLD